MSEKLTTEDVDELIEASNRQIREETSVFYRYIANEIDWRDRLICIMGARGVGKTTLMRQRLSDSCIDALSTSSASDARLAKRTGAELSGRFLV